jgi:hypothetical protein
MMAPPQTYLILIRDDSLALALGEALEERLLADGHSGAALVPAVRGADFASIAADWLQQARALDPGLGGQPPHLVALQEDGLLERLEPLGLAAFVGVPQDQEWRVVPWGEDAGAMMLPVATARQMVDAVASHTPWSRYAKVDAVASFRRRSEASWAWRGSPEISSKIVAASHGRPAGSLSRELEVGGITGSG